MDIAIALSCLSGNLLIAKDEIDNIYWPAFNLNPIRAMEPEKGYQIKLVSAINFCNPVLCRDGIVSNFVLPLEV